MSWEDRAYNRDEDYMFGSGERRGGQFGGGGFRPRISGKSVVTWLLIINAIVFVLDNILTGSSRASGLSPFRVGNFNVEQGIYQLQLWRLFTYQFLHADLFHILFNMIVLYFFGPMLEQWWGSRRFVVFYLLCGASGAVFMTLFVLVAPGLLDVSVNSPLVGASGSIYGILIGAAILFPNHRMMLMIPPIPMSLRTMALIFIGIAVLTIIVGGQNAGGEAAHLGGALLGFMLVKVPFVLDWADGLSPTAVQHKIETKQRERSRQKQISKEQEVDRILDKVKKQGLASLTERERKVLQQTTDEMHRS